MAKGPAFREGNAQRHRNRMGDPPRVEVDVERLRVELSVQAVRDRGGLTHEERKELRRRVSEIQKPKEKRERRIEEQRQRSEENSLPTGPGLFLCGCNPKSERLKGYYSDIESDGMGGTRLTNKRKDAQGNEVCPEHGLRMYGFESSDRSSPPSSYRAVAVQGELGSPGITDQRDQRDPATVGQEWLDRAGAARNGHSKALSNGAPMVTRLGDTPEYPPELNGLEGQR